MVCRIRALLPGLVAAPVLFLPTLDSTTSDSFFQIECEARCTGKTGVEMEAMVGASVAALAVYDMCKAVDKGIAIREVRLLRKTGGKSGVYETEID